MTQHTINGSFINDLVMRYRAVLFDLDGTLVKPKIGQGKDNQFRRDPKDVTWIDEQHRAVVQALYQRGIAIAFCTNQGLTPFLRTEEEAETFIREHEEVSAKLAKEVGPQVRTYICFTYPPVDYKPQLTKYVNANDPMRKPNPGMLMQAMNDLFITDAGDVLFVGDRMEDDGAAEGAGTAFMDASEFFERAYN